MATYRLAGLAQSIILALTGIAPIGALAADVNFYGLRIGEPPAIPTCKAKSSGTAPKPTVCYERDKSGPLGTEPVSVRWTGAAPSTAYWQSFNAWLVDGRVERIVMWTRGLDAQRSAYEELVAKFGRPSTSETAPYQNRLGWRFEGIKAAWRLGSVQVQFVGLDDSLERGEISIASDDYRTDAARRPAPANALPKM